MNPATFIRKPRELGEVLGDSFSFLRANLKFIYKPILLIGVLWGITYSLGLYFGYINLSANRFTTGTEFKVYLSSQTLITTVSGIASLSIFIILFNLINFKINHPDEEPTSSDLFNDFANKFFRLFLYSVIGGLLWMIFFILLIIPGIWFSVIFIFLFPVTFFENETFGIVLTRTRFLIKNEWWNSFFCYLIPSLVIGIVLAPLSGALGFYLVSHSSKGNFNSTIPNGLAIFYFFFILFSAFLNLWPSACLAFQYFSLVEKKDQNSLSRNIDSLGIGGPNQELSGPEEY